MTASPPPIAFRAALLDMDGTLVDSDAVVERCWRRWAARHGIDVAELLKLAHGRQAYATMAELLPDRPMADNIADGQRMLVEETADLDGVVPVPGAVEFVASLAGLPHALVTSADAALARARLGHVGLAVPAVAITAECVSASKPDPEGFLKAAAELGFPARDCVVFEDSEAGIRAGLAAGARVIGVGPRAAAFGPTAHVPTLEGVRVEAAADGGLLLRLPG
jgi:mannitol-1-/sugar-/sorbitol-6-phosphatase